MACVADEVAELLAVGGQRHGERAAELDAGAIVQVGEAHGAGDRPVGRRDGRGALRLDAEPRDDRLAADAADGDQRGVDALRLGRRLERACEHLVEVDRACQVAESAPARALRPGPFERVRDVPREPRHPCVDLGERRLQLVLPRLLRTRPAAEPQQDDENECAGCHGECEYR